MYLDIAWSGGLTKQWKLWKLVFKEWNLELLLETPQLSCII